MFSLVDVRPPALDVLFRPGNTLTITATWSPTGTLDGRTFSADLAGAALTTAVDVTGDVMTIVVTDAETAALAVGVPVEFELAENIGGTDEPVIVGEWTPSNEPRAVSSTSIEVTQGAATVELTVSGIGASVGDLVVAGDLDVAGAATFDTSPIVPNPAAGATSAASLGEVQALIQESSAGFFRSMAPKTPVFPAVANSTVETSLLDTEFSIPKPTETAVYRLVATGILRNTSGGPVTVTFRLRNETDAALLCSAAVVLADDANAQRPWRFEVVTEGQTTLVPGLVTVGHLVVGAGNTDPLQQALGQIIAGAGSDPQDWDLTAQLSVADVGATVSTYSAQILYALPGA